MVISTLAKSSNASFRAGANDHCVWRARDYQVIIFSVRIHEHDSIFNNFSVIGLYSSLINYVLLVWTLTKVAR
jgi:hypothetical protein